MTSINKVSVAFGAVTLFSDVSFVITKRERVALVGKNGAGKSTLLKLIAGIEVPTSGTIDRPKSVRIGYLPQVMTHIDGKTVYQECEEVFSYIKSLEQEVDAMALEMASRVDHTSPEYLDLIERYSERSEELHRYQQGGYHAQIERTLSGLGFEREDFHRESSSFSGGWRMRIELAKILLASPDLLLLDEPTNHLDIESIRWLEKFIAQSSSALMLISHDKAFLDASTTRTIEIEHGRIYDYKTNYSDYVRLREERLLQQQRAYDNQQKSIQETEAFIERFRYKATKAVQVQSRIKQLEKIDRIELDTIDRRAIHFKFTSARPSGAYPIRIEDLSKSYGSHTVFSGANITIKRGEKVAFVGKNGSGKSTMIKCITGEITDYSGELTLGHQVEVGYFAQNQSQELNNNLTVFETIDQIAEGDIRSSIRDLLGAFMFGGEASDKKVSVLSGGERGRLAIIKLLLRPSNVLILDEPTNHLDIRSKEVLKEAIASFDGTVILVSHDREFLDGLVTRIYEFKQGRVREHMGGIHDWLYKRELEDEQSNPRATTVRHESHTSNPSATDLYNQQKEQNKQRRAWTMELKKCEDRSEAIDQELSDIELKLSGDVNPDLFVVYERLKEEQAGILARWEELALLLEE